MEGTLVRQVDSSITMADLSEAFETGNTIAVPFGPVANSREDSDVLNSTKQIILDTYEDLGTHQIFGGVTADAGATVTITCLGEGQDITIQFN